VTADDTRLLELAERLERLEAIEAIKQLKARYFFACDNKQPDQVRGCFVDGAMVIDYGRIGAFSNADDMVAVFARLACEDHIVEMHHAQNPQITVHSRERASALWGLYYYMIDTRARSVTQLAGFYEDEYRCVAGQWKISQTRYQVTSTQLLDWSEGLARVVFAGRQAPAAVDDPTAQAR
jgi:hypothetical protein